MCRSFLVLLMATSLFGCFKREKQSVYFGTTHLHSNISDGILTFDELLKSSKSHSRFNFISVTEHRYWLRPDSYQKIKKATKKFSNHKFVAFAGQEIFYYKEFNLISVINFPHLLAHGPNYHPKFIFRYLNEFKEQNPDQKFWAELNHPESVEKDYGLSTVFNGNREEFVKSLDPIVQLVDIGAHKFDTFENIPVSKPETLFAHIDITDEGLSYWFKYLQMGFHLGPKIDNNAHSIFPGQLFSGRTGLWIKGRMNQKKIARAFQNRHCYVTEDLNLKVFAKVNNKNLPGDIFKIDSSMSLNIDLRMDDEDEPEASYEIQVYKGLKGAESLPTKLNNDDLQLTINGDKAQIKVDNIEPQNSFFIVHIKQISQDPINQSDHADVWLSPIWIESI